MKIGVIGVGHLGRHHARIYSELDDVELVGVADVIGDRAEEVAAEFGGRAVRYFGDLLVDVEAVSIAVPTEEHAKIARDCLKNGIDILVEKPIALNAAEAQSMIDCARENARILQVGHVERFNPVVLAAKGMATEPQFFEVHRLSVFSMRSLDVDVVLDLMIHDIDIIMNFVESEVAEIRAVGIPVLSKKPDIANARIEFKDGCVANLTASRVSTDKVRKLRFFQPHDYISLDLMAQQGHVLSLQDGMIHEHRIEAVNDEPLKLQLERFVTCVRNREKPLVDGEAGLAALNVALLINEKIKSGLEGRSVARRSVY